MKHIARSYSAASTLHACARRFQHEYVERLAPAEPEAPYLVGGTAGHAAFKALYTVEWDLQGALEALHDAWGAYQTPPGHKHGYLTLGHMELVLEEYFRDRSENPTAMEQEDARPTREGAEERVVFEWPNPETGEIIEVSMIPDLPTLLANQRYIIDNKFTTSWLNSHWAKRYTLAHQLRVYAAGMQILQGESYEGAYINAVYIGEPPKRGWGSGKSVQNMLLGPFSFSDAHLLETWHWMKAAQEQEALFTQLGHWPQNEQACHEYGGCDFLPICERRPELRQHVMRQLYQVQPERER